MEHCAPGHHLEDAFAVAVTEAQGAPDLAPPRGHDGQADVPLGHHLEGEVVVARHSADEPARVVLVRAFLVGDDRVKDDHIATYGRVPPHSREGWPWLVLDVSWVALGAFQSWESRLSQGATGPWVAHVARVSRGPRIPLISLKALDACPDARDPCGEKVLIRSESIVSAHPQGDGWDPTAV